MQLEPHLDCIYTHDTHLAQTDSTQDNTDQNIAFVFVQMLTVLAQTQNNSI